MATNARKAVQTAILDTWSRGASIIPAITDLGGEARGGDSIDVPAIGAATVNTSETASPEAVSNSADALVINRPKYINRAVTQQQYDQLLNGGGNFVTQLMRGTNGDMLNAMDRDVIEYLYSSVAATSVDNHFNLDGGAVTDEDVNDCEASIREQDGVANTNSGFFWIMSPIAEGKIKSVADLNPADAVNLAQATGQFTNLGLPPIGLLNGIPAFKDNNVPGRVNSQRHQAVISASSITTNVLSVTVPSGHGFVVGQQVWTSGLDTNVPVTAPSTIVTAGATTITMALTAANDADAGTGTLYSATAYALLCYAPWIFFAADNVVPKEFLTKREGNAGWSLQLYNQIGRVAHPGAVRILHTRD